MSVVTRIGPGEPSSRQKDEAFGLAARNDYIEAEVYIGEWQAPESGDLESEQPAKEGDVPGCGESTLRGHEHKYDDVRCA